MRQVRFILSVIVVIFKSAQIDPIKQRRTLFFFKFSKQVLPHNNDVIDVAYHPGTPFGSPHCPVAGLKTVFFGHFPILGCPDLKQEKKPTQSDGSGRRS